MKSRAARLAVLMLFVGALGVTAYLFRDSGLAADIQSAAALKFGEMARMTTRGVLELRAAQQAYVATGQEGDFWTRRVAETSNSVRGSLETLRSFATSSEAQTELESARSALQDFTQMDVRARDYINSGQKLLASDLIFSNGLELTEGVLASIDRARAVELGTRTAAAATFERRQIFALAAAAAAAMLTALLLLPRIEAPPEVLPLNRTAIETPVPRGVSEPADVSLEGEGWTTARKAAESVAAEPMPAAPEPIPESTVAVSPAVAPDAPPPFIPAFDYNGVASLCTELSQLEDPLALPPLLERAATLLDANGIILWITDPDGRELNPIMAQGYPSHLISRLGPLARDAENATAAAFRTSVVQTVRAEAGSNGAIAAPLVTAGGCVGVMAAEIKGDIEKDDAKLAAAKIVAAQLASLVGPPAARAQDRVEAAR